MSSTELRDLPTEATSLIGSTTLRIPPGLTKAMAVANHYLRSPNPVEVIDPHDECAFHGDGPATKEAILDITTTVLAALDSDERVNVPDYYGTRVTAEGTEYSGFLSEQTPEHLVDVAAFSMVAAIHLRREADEAMDRAVVALALVKPAN
jgi:hypothetical protein